jgi:acetyl-CoA acetyltransferase
MGLEDFGFCKPGERPFVADGSIRREERLPVNTHGGNLAEVYLTASHTLAEAVRQLRGTAANQIAGRRVALVVSAPARRPRFDDPEEVRP